MSKNSYKFLLLSLLVSCKVGPDYQRPEIALPDAFPNQKVIEDINVIEEVSEERTEEKPVIKKIKKKEFVPEYWWQGFKDETLDKVIFESLRNNKDIASSYASLQEAQAIVRIIDAQDALRADISADASYSYMKELDPSNASDSDKSAAAGLGLSLPADLAGQNDRAVESAIAQYLQIKALLDDKILETSSAVAINYLRLRGNQRQLELLEGSVDLQKQTLAIVNSRFESGISPELDFQRAKAAVASLEADIPQLKRTIEQLKNRLATLSGNFVGHYNELLDEQSPIPNYEAKIISNLPVAVINKRPDVVAAEQTLIGATADIGVARAELYPSLNLLGAVSIATTGIDTRNNITEIISGISAVIDYNLLDGGAIRGNIEAAEARAEKALRDYEQAILISVEEVEAALIEVKNLQNRITFLDNAVEANRKSAGQADSLYRQGLTSFLDVVDAQRALASAQQQLATAKTEYAVQTVNLFQATGTQDYEIETSE